MLLFIFIVCVTFGQVVQAQCREGWQVHGDSCYSYGDSTVTFAAAQEICKLHFANLAEVDNADENNFLKDMSRNKSAGYTWIGGTDIFDEGNWVWMTSGNLIFAFTDWAPNQPDEYLGAEDCLCFAPPAQYQWNDCSCDVNANFICEGQPLRP